MSETALHIVEEKAVIDEHLLDIIGNEFKFSHEKGLSEWLKNSVDAYAREDVADKDSFVTFRFSLRGNPVFECIDFVGMLSKDIDKAVKIWGDPEAAKRNLKKKDRKVFGGHGNGGKFYMRQMFKTSHFLTYRSGKLNVFGFNENRKYGFAKDYKDKDMSPAEAMEFAGIKDLDIPALVKAKIMKGLTGFTVVRGLHPRDVSAKKFNLNKLCDKFKGYPQARRILKNHNVSVFFNGELFYERLLPEELAPLPGFETPVEINIPAQIYWEEEGEKEAVSLANDKYSQGKLTLYTSSEPLSYHGRLGELNCVDFLGQIGVIASYKIRELGFVNRLSFAEFIYGECTCPMLEDPEDDCVTNDRAKLVENITTKALRKWISQQIDTLAAKMEEKEQKKIEAKKIETLDELNKYLNEWKNRFMSKVTREILGGAGLGPGAGFGEGGGTGGLGGKKNKGEGGDAGSGEGAKPGGGGEHKPKQTFPVVLLSSIDDDPLSPGAKFSLSDRQPPVYQRPEDVQAGIYWINMNRKLADHIFNKYGVKSLKWRDYHFQRMVDIICKEALRQLEKKDPENFNADMVDAEIIDKLVGKAHDSAVESLGGFLLEEEFKTPEEKHREQIDGLKGLGDGEKEKLEKELKEAIREIKKKKVDF